MRFHSGEVKYASVNDLCCEVILGFMTGYKSLYKKTDLANKKDIILDSNMFS